jgi:hypothetical protein
MSDDVTLVYPTRGVRAHPVFIPHPDRTSSIPAKSRPKNIFFPGPSPINCAHFPTALNGIRQYYMALIVPTFLQRLMESANTAWP